MHELHAVVSGKVQGVGYRDFVQREARARGLTGWVKNLADGSVEVVAQGERDMLLKLTARLWKGPSVSRVDAVTTEWGNTTEMRGTFKIQS